MRSAKGWMWGAIVGLGMAAGGCKGGPPATQPAEPDRDARVERKPRPRAVGRAHRRHMVNPLALGMEWTPRRPRQGDWVQGVLVMANQSRLPIVVLRVTFQAPGVCPPLRRDYLDSILTDAVEVNPKNGSLILHQHWRYEPMPPMVAMVAPRPRIVGSGQGGRDLVRSGLVLMPGARGRRAVHFQANHDGPVRATADVRYVLVNPGVLRRGVYEYVAGNRWAEATPEAVERVLRPRPHAAERPRRRKARRLEVVTTYRPVMPAALDPSPGARVELKELIFDRAALSTSEGLKADFELALGARTPSLATARTASGVRPARVAFFRQGGLWAIGDGRRCALVGANGRVALLTQDHTALLKAVSRSSKSTVELTFPAAATQPAQGRPGLADLLQSLEHRPRKAGGFVYTVPVTRLIDVLTVADQHEQRVGWPGP